MSATLRKEVLNGFKNLHRTRQKVFRGDNLALTAGRDKINEEYKKCKNVQDVNAVAELIKYAEAVENELRTTVIQAKEVKPGMYEAHIADDIIKLDNVPFKECSNS